MNRSSAIKSLAFAVPGGLISDAERQKQSKQTVSDVIAKIVAAGWFHVEADHHEGIATSVVTLRRCFHKNRARR